MSMNRRGFIARLSAAFVAAIPATRRPKEFWEEALDEEPRREETVDGKNVYMNTGSDAYAFGSDGHPGEDPDAPYRAEYFEADPWARQANERLRREVFDRYRRLNLDR